MKRILFMVIRLIYMVPYWFYKICKYGKSDCYTEEEKYDQLHSIMHRINQAGRVTIDAHGMENLPKKDGYIMFPNHQGLFDTLALFESHEKPFTFVVKKEMENVILPMKSRALLITMARTLPLYCLRFVSLASARHYSSLKNSEFIPKRNGTHIIIRQADRRHP